MDLLERDAALTDLHAALDHAIRGEGHVALVSGEAGVGKTSLVERFARERRASMRVLWGACDALSTPRPLGPLYDIAAQAGGALAHLLTGSAERSAVFGAMLAEVQSQPGIAVVEDVHWADEATLDVLRYIGRRIRRSSALLVLTYRDDELVPAHPLRTLLGDLASSTTTLRIPLAPLSEGAVRVLIGERAIDAAALHRRTGGNPFFVSEILGSSGTGLPQSIRDAVLGRVARMRRPAVAVLEAAAVAGPRVELTLLASMLPPICFAAGGSKPPPAPPKSSTGQPPAVPA
jgi:predicted ATPase